MPIFAMGALAIPVVTGFAAKSALDVLSLGARFKVRRFYAKSDVALMVQNVARRDRANIDLVAGPVRQLRDARSVIDVTVTRAAGAKPKKATGIRFWRAQSFQTFSQGFVAHHAPVVTARIAPH